MYIVLEQIVQAMLALLCINESCSLLEWKYECEQTQPGWVAVENALMRRFPSKIQLTRSLIILY